MADNYPTNPGSGGPDFASDEIASVHYPRVKLITGADGVNDGDVDDLSPLPVAETTHSALSVHHRVSSADTNLVNIKASAGKVYGWAASNVNAAVRYLKLYDKASVPVLASDVPLLTLLLPVNGSNTGSIPGGLTFTLGIGMALTVEATDAGATGVAANEQVVQVIYK